MFAATARPGNKLVNGMIYGVSQAFGGFSIGFVLKSAPDNLIYLGLISTCIVSNIGYYLMGGG